MAPSISLSVTGNHLYHLVNESNQALCGVEILTDYQGYIWPRWWDTPEPYKYYTEAHGYSRPWACETCAERINERVPDLPSVNEANGAALSPSLEDPIREIVSALYSPSLSAYQVGFSDGSYEFITATRVNAELPLSERNRIIQMADAAYTQWSGATYTSSNDIPW